MQRGSGGGAVGGSLVVVDISSDSLAASFGTRLAAASGATVIKVEGSPDPLRARRPMVAMGEEEVSLPFTWTSPGKLWVRDADGALTEALTKAADVVVASDRVALPQGGAAVVVTPFGLSGPRSGWKASSRGLFHAGGLGFVTPRAPQQGGADDTPPQAPNGNIAEYFGGIYIATVVMAHALGPGVGLADVSLQQVLVPLVRRETAAWLYDSYLASRRERLWRVAPSGFYPTVDGHVYVNVIENEQWAALCDILGVPEAVDDPRFSGAEARFMHLHELDELLSPWFATHSNAEIFEITGRRGVPVGPASTMAELRASPQLRERRAFDRGPQRIEFPALPLRLAGDDRPRPGDWNPSLGRDTDRVVTWLERGAPRGGI